MVMLTIIILIYINKGTDKYTFNVCYTNVSVYFRKLHLNRNNNTNNNVIIINNNMYFLHLNFLNVLYSNISICDCV